MVPDAVHAEYLDAVGTPVVTELACSLQGRQIEVELCEGSLLRRLYGAPRTRERTTCSFGLAVGLEPITSAAGMRVAAVDDTGEVRAVERIDHPFFVGTLYQPQLSSTPAAPHPVLAGLVDALGTALP